MKELSIEEKAKAYDEALERAREEYEIYKGIKDVYHCEALERIFHKLAESEDERIRKELLNYLYDSHDDDEERARWIAWLEKQGDKDKHTYSTYSKDVQLTQEEYDKRRVSDEATIKEVEAYNKGLEDAQKIFKKQGKQNLVVTPKFRIGDIITPKGKKEYYTIIDIVDGWYEFREKHVNGGIPIYYQSGWELVEQKPADKVKPKFHEGEWVFIEEVKGYKNGPFQIKTVDSFGYSFDEYHTIPFMYEDLLSKWTIQDAKDGNVLACESGWTCIFKKFNHNSFGGLLFDSYCFIDRTGWFCDGAEGHTLDERINGKIYPATKEQRDQLEKAMADAGYTFDFEKKELKKIEQLTTFEEAIKDMMNDYRDAIGDNDATIEEIKKHSEYLLSLIPQKPTWSEEDEKQRRQIERIVSNDGCTKKLQEQIHNWFESLKDRCLPQQKQEWSEEDEKILMQIIHDV